MPSIRGSFLSDLKHAEYTRINRVINHVIIELHLMG